MEEGKMLERVNAFRIKEKDKTKKRKIRIKSAMGTLEKLEDLEKYFEYMASTGWMIEKIYAGSVLVFAECEPKKVRFMIKKFAESGLTKNSAIEKNIDFLEYCINKEWTYVCVTNMIGVFYTTKENLKKVEIDYEYVRNDKSYKEGVMARVIIPFIVSIFIIVTIIFEIKNHYIAIALDYGKVYSLFMMILLVLWWISHIVSYLRWKSIIKKTINENGTIVNECDVTHINLAKTIIVILATIGTVFCFVASKIFYGELGDKVLIYPFIYSAIGVLLSIVTYFTSKRAVSSLLVGILTTTLIVAMLFSPFVTFSLEDLHDSYEINTDTTLNVSDLKKLGEKVPCVVENDYEYNVVNKEVNGDFIIKAEKYSIEEYEKDHHIYTYYVYVYSTASKHLHDKMLDDTLNNYNSDCLGNRFSLRSGRCTEYEKDDGVKIYTDNWNAFLITDDKTMICISELYEMNLDYNELFDYVRELLKKY